VLGACLFTRAAALEKIGYLDENLFFYNDDLDLCKRAKSAGYKVVYFPDAEIYHYGGYSSKKDPDKRFIIEGFRGGLYYCKKHYSPMIYQIYRAMILLFMPIFAVFSLANRVKRSAYLDIFTIALKQQIVHRS
jgi:GT2 family glycosyltransferase